MSMWWVSFLVHSSGTSRLPPGHILTEHANTSGIQMTPTKFVDVKSVPKMIGHVICLQTIKDCVNGWLFIVKVQVTWPRAPMSSPDAFLMNGWYPVSRSLPKDTYAE